MSAKPYFFRLLLILVAAQFVFGAGLEQDTVRAFDRYIHRTEARIQKQVDGRNSFLWVDASQDRRARVRCGEVIIGHFGDSAIISVPGGLVHHWIGAVFVPGGTLGRTLALVEDYDHHNRYYGPEVERSKLLRRNGDEFRVYYRLRKKKIVTVVLDTEHEVRYFRLDEKRAWSRSYSVKIAEVASPGRPGEHELPEGGGHGFLWRLYSYWRFEQRDGGVYIECEAVSLTRGIPLGLMRGRLADARHPAGSRLDGEAHHP